MARMFVRTREKFGFGFNKVPRTVVNFQVESDADNKCAHLKSLGKAVKFNFSPLFACLADLIWLSSTRIYEKFIRVSVKSFFSSPVTTSLPFHARELLLFV